MEGIPRLLRPEDAKCLLKLTEDVRNDGEGEKQTGSQHQCRICVGKGWALHNTWNVHSTWSVERARSISLNAFYRCRFPVREDFIFHGLNETRLKTAAVCENASCPKLSDTEADRLKQRPSFLCNSVPFSEVWMWHSGASLQSASTSKLNGDGDLQKHGGCEFCERNFP